jgi:TBC1 domain family protein 5
MNLGIVRLITFFTKLFLAKHEPLQSSSSPRVSNLLEWLRASRMQYTTLMLEKTRVPDGNYDQISQGTQGTTSTENLDLINPLSLHNEVC